MKVLPKQIAGAALLLLIVLAAGVDAEVGVVADVKLLLINPNERRPKVFLETYSVGKDKIKETLLKERECLGFRNVEV